MQQVSSSELNSRPGAVLKKAQSSAVEITTHGKPAVVMIPADQYEKMGGERARLLAVMRELQDEAAANGLTPEDLEKILNEDE